MYPKLYRKAIKRATIVKTHQGWYVGQLKDIPEVLSQGRTIKELRDNLLDVLVTFREMEHKKVTFKLKNL